MSLSNRKVLVIVKVLVIGNSHIYQKKLANTSSTLTATIESSSWGTTSSKWSSAEKRDQPVPELSTDDESSSSSDGSLPKYKSAPQAVQKQQPSSSVVKQSPISPVSEPPAKRSTGPGSEGSKQNSVWNTVEDDVDQGGFTPSATKPSQRPIQLPGVDTRAGTEEGSDWDEDDLSELEDIGNGATSASILRASTDSTIRDRAALIESQLMVLNFGHNAYIVACYGTKVTVPLVNGKLYMLLREENLLFSKNCWKKRESSGWWINTLTVPTEVTSLSNQTAESEEEDSLEAELAAHTTTNTYSSRQWGQGSAANTLSASGKQGSSSLAPSGEKASSVTSENVSLTTVTGTAQKGDSGSDWSDDIDLCDL
ncbi:hypothetical protein EB796_013522 [Bugula neritina]|uniref:Uncharacterized protein n=1 Tax=Bugula neritina TaxID=10212 RepID=A0A7J7JR80_BUGNE|nr:hypothetical protein EB796_013522 [Bugula neritina]